MNLQILTNDGYKNFNHIRKTTNDLICKIKTETGKVLCCTLFHELKVENEWACAMKLRPNMRIETDLGLEKIIEMKFTREVTDFFDVCEVESTHSYFTNGILSHNCDFIGSSDTLIPGPTLKNLTYIHPLKENEALKIFKMPQEDHSYFMTVDVSEGRGKDFHVIMVFDITTFPYEVVCIYRENTISHLLLPDKIMEIGGHYNEAPVLIEINSVGLTVAELLTDENEYENVLGTMNNGRAGQTLTSVYMPNSDKGIKMTSPVKRIGCTNLKLMLQKGQLFLNAHEILSELQKFVKKGSSYAAMSGANDDLVMCLVIFSWAMQNEFFKEINDTDVIAQLRMAEDDSNSIAGFFDDGTDIFDPSNEPGW